MSWLISRLNLDSESRDIQVGGMNNIKQALILALFISTFPFQMLAQVADAPTTPVTQAPAAPAVDKDALLKKVALAINPDADGDKTERFRKGLAALADLNAAGSTPEQSVANAKLQGNLSGSKTEKMAKMLLEMWSLNVDRMSEAATLDALRNGNMPNPALKRP